MRFSQATCFLDINKLTEMSTTRGEHLSFTAIRNDQKRRTWRGDRSSPKHRKQRRRTSRIARRPARDVWKHELYEAKGRQIIRKCKILKQMTREARKRIYHLGKLKKGHATKSSDVSNPSAATRRAESRSVWR